MRRLLTFAAVALAAFAVGSAATAAGGWKVFATATDTDEYGVFVSADAKVVKPKGLAIRVSGDVENAGWYLSCEMDKEPARAGVYVISVQTADTCSVTGKVTTDTGKGVVQLLRR